MWILLISFLVLLMLKFPVSASLFISSWLYMIMNNLSMSLAVQRMISGVNSFTMLAVPGFILAANLMSTTGITDELFTFARSIVGRFRGGMAYANVLNSVFFAGMSGSAVADAAGPGQLEYQMMVKSGYKKPFSAAITASSAIIGPIIPPSISLVIYASATSTSVGRLFIGSVIPGIMAAMSICIIIFSVAKKEDLPKEKPSSLREIWQCFRSAFFALLTPVIMMGGIMVGIFTPTEAAMVAVGYATIISLIRKRLTFKAFIDCLLDTVSTTSMTMFIMANISIFSYLITITRFPQTLAAFLTDNFTSKILVLLLLNVFLVLVGCVMNPTPAIMILAPILLPTLIGYGVDPIHFGVFLSMALCVGMCTPPVGMVLFVMQSYVKIKSEDMIKAILPYVVALYIVALIVSLIPQLTTWLPNLLLGPAG